MKKLRPFFRIFGAKHRLVGRGFYAPPEHDTVIEPFAGSAAYATRHYERNVVLYDLDEMVVGTWDFLINASRADILSLPASMIGKDAAHLKAPQEARWLVGWWLSSGAEMPVRTPSPWMRKEEGKRGGYWSERERDRLAEQSQLIKHWRVHLTSYKDIEYEEPATWFIDPPYQVAGKKYRKSSKNIDFEHLGKWCQDRKGQVTVCENAGAEWLPFQHLTEIVGNQNTRSKEVIWANYALPPKEPTLADIFDTFPVPE